MSVKDLTTYEVLKDEDLKGIKAKGKLLKLSLIHILDYADPMTGFVLIKSVPCRVEKV